MNRFSRSFARRLRPVAAALAACAALSAAFVAGPARADTHEVVIAYQDMVVPWRFAQASGAGEKPAGVNVT